MVGDGWEAVGGGPGGDRMVMDHHNLGGTCRLYNVEAPWLSAVGEMSVVVSTGWLLCQYWLKNRGGAGVEVVLLHRW